MLDPSKMQARAPWGPLSVVLILVCGHPREALACPHPCACYVPSEVHCTFRSLPSVPAGISKHVERINLGFNSIQALSETSFAGMTKLELLMIHGNDIPSIPDGALRDLTSLQVFKFSYNKLRVITRQTLQGLSNLVRLHVDHNKIEFIHPHAFQGLLALRLLHLEGNLLHQLHPATFSTFSFLDHFRLSTIRHLYLADNVLRALPEGLLGRMPLLENLYLQGNPWACDCGMRWLLGWAANSRGVLKCKKDKAYEGGQLCAACSSPRELEKQEIHRLTDVACRKPSIESPLRLNGTGVHEEDQEQPEAGDSPLAAQGLRPGPWNITLNMTDEHGNQVLLACDIQQPTALSSVLLNQTDPAEIEVNATLALDVWCPMTREKYEKLWKLIAYYSEVPVMLHREIPLGAEPGRGYQYRQDANEDALYYTGVRAQLLAEPGWVMQPSVAIQLDRRLSTASRVRLSYSALLAQTVSTKDAQQARGRSWVMIEPGGDGPRAQAVLEGSPCQLSCNVKASESPSIFWVLPDGSVLKAPMADRDGKFSILSSGWLRIRSMEQADSGLYQCIAQVRDETDRVVYRVIVQTPTGQPPEGSAVTIHKHSGEPALLPCNVLAIPEAHVSWILPNKRMVNDQANTSHAYMLPNGTLSIPEVQPRDDGHYRCVAVNRQGVDHFTVGIRVTGKGTSRSPKRGRRPSGRALPRARGDMAEDQGGSGMEDEEHPSRTGLHPKDQEAFFRTKDEPTGEDKKAKKGRRKLKVWKPSEKEPESSVAEGRRVFESRRRINVANKQINPERWADILARVRSKNLPKGTEVPPGIKTTTASPTSPEATPLSPVVSLPSVFPVQMATNVEESSTDASLFGEEEQVSSAIPLSRMGIEGHHSGAMLAEPRVTSVPLEEALEHELSKETEEKNPTGADRPWVAATTLSSEPYESSPTLHMMDTVYRELLGEDTVTEDPSTAAHTAFPQPTANPTEPPLEAIYLAEAEAETVRYFHPASETHAQPEDEEPSSPFPLASTMWVTASNPPESFEGHPLGNPDTPAHSHLRGPTESVQLVESSLSTQHTPLTKKGKRRKSQRDPGASTGQDRKPIALPDPTLAAVSSVSPSLQPREVTQGTPWDKEATTPTMMRMSSPSMPATQSSRRRLSGRRRLRPNRLRHHHKQIPSTTFASTETFTPPTQAPEVKVPSEPQGSPAPTPWVDNTANTPQQLEMGKGSDLASRGTPRRKSGKRPYRHRYTTPTVSSPVPVPEFSTSADNKQEYVTLGSAMVSLPRSVLLKTEELRNVTREEDHPTTTTKTPPSRNQGHETSPTTYQPVPDRKEVRDDGVTNGQESGAGKSVPTEPIVNVLPTFTSVVSTMEEFKEEASSMVGTLSWDPWASTPDGLHTESPVASLGEELTDPTLFEEIEDIDATSEFPTSVAVFTPSQGEEFGSAATNSSLKVGLPSTPAGTTATGHGNHAATPVPSPSETSQQNTIPASTQTEQAESSFPPMTLVSLVQATTEPTFLTLRVSPASADSKGSVFLNPVGNPESRVPPVNNEGTQDKWRMNELSTPSFNWGRLTSSPKQPVEKELFASTPNSLPQGPDGHPHDGSVHIYHPHVTDPAKPTPPRGTERSLQATTQSSFRYFVTLQPPGHFTNKPEIPAYHSRAFPQLSSTTAGPLHLPETRIPNKVTEQKAEQFNSRPKTFGNDNILEPRNSVGEPPKPRAPHYSGGRFPFLFNKTFSFPWWGVTRKPHESTSPAPGTRERKLNHGPHDRIRSQSVIHVDFGPPAPPLLRPPRTTAPPSTHFQNIPLAPSTRSSVPFMTSSAPPSRSFHDSSSQSFAGGPPASKLWTLREKPQIITKPPQTISVTAETDVVLPCEATGTPRPFITWTKVSTGALMTPSTRTQRFEVLKNGTLVIRRAQVQDGGHYQCAASNLHGVDRAGALLSVTVQQPQVLAARYQDVTVYLGDTVAMECLAQGTPAPQISWIFPDRRVWGAASRVEGRVTLHENRTLSIRDASFSDRGVYKCVASNAAGADSLAIRLHVAALPPVIEQDEAENISLPPGLSVHIHCSARAAPPASVRWVLRDGTHVRPSQFLRGNLFVFPNGTLYIRHLAPGDSGRYDCVAANPVGAARRTVRLSVRRHAATARITGSSPRSTDVVYGQTLRLHCSAAGDPWPRVLWRLPSKRVIDAFFSFDTRVKVFTNGTLAVKSVTDKDAGDYLCVARNKVGDDYVVLKVNVVMKPAKIEHKEENDHRVFYGGDLKVDCVATGLPNPEISWSLPDGSLVSSLMQSDDGGGRAKRYVVFHNGTLYFNDVGLREEGDYTCFAENQVGKDEMKVRVKVVAEPAAVRNKTYAVVHVPYGDVVTVTCEAKGEPVPKVTWLSPTNRLIPTSSDKYQIYQDGTLLIQKAQRSDSGNYTCLVKSGTGEDRKTVWVHVRVQPPRINGHPNAITTVREVAPTGSRRLIACHAEGIPQPRVLWAFPEGVILPSPYYGNRVTVHRNGTLDIKSLRKSDSVQLVCMARNEGGEARLVVQLTVLEATEKPIFHDPVSEKITATAGHTINLNCSATGTPPPTVVWVLPNGTELRSGQQLHRFFHKGDGMLHISGLSPGDAGAYRCVARNSAGHMERLVSLRVGLRPESGNKYPNLVSVIDGELLQLHCVAPGTRQGRFSWTLPSGMSLDGPQRVGRFSVLENGTLTVRAASVFDRGTYLCRAETEHGTSVVSTPVIVIAYPPRITSEPTPVIYARPGGTVKITCMAMGVPRAEISWELPDKSHLNVGTQARLYGNRFLHPQGSLTIQHITPRDTGFYRCTAKNVLGTDSKTTYVHVY